MSTLLAQRPKKFIYQRGTIECRKCAAPINIYRLKTLPDEFSVRCTKCGARAVYFKHAVALQDMPERRKKPRA